MDNHVMLDVEVAEVLKIAVSIDNFLEHLTISQIEYVKEWIAEGEG